MRLQIFRSLTLLLLFPASVSAQMVAVESLDSFPAADVNWYNKDYSTDYIAGSSVDRAYSEILSGKKARLRIVVAVIDGGVDISHEDLSGKIWVNAKEIAGNRIDDDNNGYVDDINGWNFLGNWRGQNVLDEVLEPVRIVSELDSSLVNYASIDVVPDSLRELYKMYVTCKELVEEKRLGFKNQLATADALEVELLYCERLVTRFLGKQDATPAEICAIETQDLNLSKASQFLCDRYARGYTKADMESYKSGIRKNLDKTYNVNYKPRKILGDNPKDINDRNYGNNNVIGPRADHGTFVAGIIAANRGNALGIDGIAERVEIMAIRTTPDGDEDDKDVALGIRYAVDNGARIINMSFGKDFSLRKALVDSALRYAESKNVLLIHAAGNSGLNLDKNENYPTNIINDTLEIKSWMNVGAHSAQANLNFCGVFSNYGKKSVDIFAPGVRMVSLAPNNRYSQGDGTSFAAPVVTAIAALVWSHYPQLSALQIKDILIKSAQSQEDMVVYEPSFEGKKKKTKFTKLSKTGGIVNAYEAMKLAENMAKSLVPEN